MEVKERYETDSTSVNLDQHYGMILVLVNAKVLAFHVDGPSSILSLTILVGFHSNQIQIGPVLT